MGVACTFNPKNSERSESGGWGVVVGMVIGNGHGRWSWGLVIGRVVIGGVVMGSGRGQWSWG